MKTLDLNVSLEGMEIDEDSKKIGAAGLASQVIKNIMYFFARGIGGLNATERKQFHRISDVVDKAVKEGNLSVELEDEDFGFLKKCKNNVKMVPSELLNRIEQKIDSVVYK
jgi:hypothetical protein